VAEGMGEIVIIKAIVSYTICMFDDNDVVHIVAPTGMTSFNVLGGGGHYIYLWV
jgi:hypothetical protein